NFVGVTYRFSKIGLENATEDDIVKLLEESRQIKPVNSKTRHLVNWLIDLKDNAGNDIWNISIHLGIAERITLKDSDGVTRSFVLNEVTDSDGGPPPMMEICEPSIDTLIRALIVIQMIDNMTSDQQEELYNSLSKEFREYIQKLKKH
ncbi:MAG TPA: hypothetical protein VET23_13965, partial [Chitinophagaceae bacterium]|nr:hypothetical protein [Chitinophagaceae bacterium]